MALSGDLWSVRNMQPVVCSIQPRQRYNQAGQQVVLHLQLEPFGLNSKINELLTLRKTISSYKLFHQETFHRQLYCHLRGVFNTLPVVEIKRS